MANAVERRRFLQAAAAGTIVTALGGSYVLAAEKDPRANEKRSDGRVRLPPGQRIIDGLKPMGGDPGDPSPSNFRLKVYGEVDNELDLDFAALTKMTNTEVTCDVHCVTGWSAFDVKWTGVKIKDLATAAKVKDTAKHVIFEAANGYTANVLRAEALADNCLAAFKINGSSIPRPNGPPVRGLVPDLYFWKSAKWLTAIKFVVKDKPGYWETRGYHNHADPWKEERYG